MAYTHKLTDKEIAHVATLLAQLEPGYLPELIFDQVTRLHVTATVVVVPLRKTTSGVEVLLVQRGTGPTEPVWPGHWHLPGTMIRPSDSEGHFEEAFNRIFHGDKHNGHGELGGTNIQGEPTFVRTAFTKTKRGPELTQVFYAPVVGDPKAGKFFPVTKLPLPHLEHEVAYIQEAAALFAGL